MTEGERVQLGGWTNSDDQGDVERWEVSLERWRQDRLLESESPSPGVAGAAEGTGGSGTPVGTGAGVVADKATGEATNPTAESPFLGPFCLQGRGSVHTHTWPETDTDVLAGSGGRAGLDGGTGKDEEIGRAHV